MSKPQQSHSYFAAHNGYEDRTYSVETTNGSERVSLVMRPDDSLTGLGASMAPDVARELGADLIERANRVDPPEVHTFRPGSGPLPDSDPEACDECGEREDHWRHYVPDPSLNDMPDPRDDALDRIQAAWAATGDDTLALRRIREILAETGRGDL